MVEVPSASGDHHGDGHGAGEVEKAEADGPAHASSAPTPPAAGQATSDDTKTSVYLDAVDDGVADLMRELRDLPEPSGNALETLIEGDAGSGPRKALAPHAPGLGEDPGAEERAVGEETKLKQPGFELSPHPAKRCSAASSLSLARRRTHSAGHERRRHERHDAVVELHEESPAAFQVSLHPSFLPSSIPIFLSHHPSFCHSLSSLFRLSSFARSLTQQDFLFWAYPHLECKVTWTNVAGVS